MSYMPPFSSTNPPPTQISPLSLHDALPISAPNSCNSRTWNHLSHYRRLVRSRTMGMNTPIARSYQAPVRSEEHTSELQSLTNLVCRLLLEKKKNILSNASSNKLTRSRKAREAYTVPRPKNARLNAAKSERPASPNPHFATRPQLDILFGYI